jgi:hypothetical protein
MVASTPTTGPGSVLRAAQKDKGTVAKNSNETEVAAKPQRSPRIQFNDWPILRCRRDVGPGFRHPTTMRDRRFRTPSDQFAKMGQNRGQIVKPI